MIRTDETTKETVSTIEGLISILEDGKLGYINAGEQIEYPAIKNEFLQYAREHVAQFQFSLTKSVGVFVRCHRPRLHQWDDPKCSSRTL